MDSVEICAAVEQSARSDMAAYMRAYRARRKAEGKPLSSGAQHPRAVEKRQVVAWDGEGVTIAGGKHIYTLLANSRGDVLENPDGIGTVDAVRFIFDTAEKYPKHIHAFFGGSYDFNMLLGDLPKAQARKVYSAASLTSVRVPDRRGGTVTLAVGWRQRRSLTLARFGDPPWLYDDVGKAIANYNLRVTMWDVIGFFQSSFVTALEKWIPGDELRALVPLIDDIRDMKKKRSSFAIADASDVRRYCLAECDALAELMSRLLFAFADANITPARWDGAGAAAGALLRREGVKKHVAAYPKHLSRAVRCAYSGGRIELTQLGFHPERIYGADIISAYPHAATSLPSLHGEWREVAWPHGFGLARVRWSFPHDAPWYPFPYRTPRGSILYPAIGEGWTWRPELEAAMEYAAMVGGAIDIFEAWELAPATDVLPFAFLGPLYDLRGQWKREGRAAEKILKLASNSCYGKLCQQLGGREGELPPYHSLAWGGWITAATRARLVRLALQDPSAVVMFATDGIFSTRKLTLPAGHGLGDWEATEPAEQFVTAQAGVYWGRDRDGAWNAKYRGFDPEGMENPDRVLSAWRAKERAIAVPCTRFVGIGSALMGEGMWRAWRTWRTVDRNLDLSGASAKRAPCNPRARPDRGLVPLLPSWNADFEVTGRTSAPYELLWERDTEPLDIDGVPGSIIDEEWES